MQVVKDLCCRTQGLETQKRRKKREKRDFLQVVKDVCCRTEGLETAGHDEEKEKEKKKRIFCHNGRAPRV